MRLFALLSTLATMPLTALAEEDGERRSQTPWRGPYLSLDVSAGQPNDPRAAGVYEADLGLELGTRLGIGYAFEHLRAEFQLGYESFLLNNVNPLPGSLLSEADTTGDLSGTLAIANLFYDFGEPGGTRPFVGAGLGFGHMKADFHGFYCFILALTCWDGEQVVNGSDTVAVWQGMAGLSRPLSNGRGEWFIAYRYFETADIELNVVGYGPVTQEGVRSHSFTLGWRFRL
jgi:opacity protein-like surface antigen